MKKKIGILLFFISTIGNYIYSTGELRSIGTAAANYKLFFMFISCLSPVLLLTSDTASKMRIVLITLLIFSVVITGCYIILRQAV